MTKRPAFKREIRQRMALIGESYTTALRAIAADRGPEPHYRFIPPRTIERVRGSEVKKLVPREQGAPTFAWGYAGSGPATAAWALLEDATGDCDQTLAIEFSSDCLDWEELGSEPFVISVAEVRAWRAERESEIRARPKSRSYGPQDLADLLREHLTSEDALTEPWWQRYRKRNARPRLS